MELHAGVMRTTSGVKILESCSRGLLMAWQGYFKQVGTSKGAPKFKDVYVLAKGKCGKPALRMRTMVALGHVLLILSNCLKG